jgi:precorrin-2 dehydrogenase/sirohydrochlorin ferrochelatase
MRYYPLFLDLKDKKCLVVGAGRVGLRKASSLLECSAGRVVMVDPAEPSGEVRALMETGALAYERREFTESDLDGAVLCFAATSSRTANEAVAGACRERSVPVNVADDPEGSDFHVPAHFARRGLTVAVGTGGASPALARRIRMDLQERLDARYGRLLTLMERLRPMVIELGLGSDENALVFREVVESPLMDALYEGKRAKAEKVLRGILPEPLKHRIGELLDGTL